ncbi:MAG: TatD family hydrolase [Planctomycetes bacterium]|nr:TatD family hydrolase [Planctomycetota bacterium]MCP4770715.1 TatD family hydrolase [Planctomycetota bacterium]MCP4861430.1 TatD family hydrolase [Planctomycetota bacterium]
MRLIDTHCHLVWREQENPPGPQLERAREAGVERFVCVATDLESAGRCQALAQKEDDVFATVGIHPNDVGSMEELQPQLQQLHSMLQESDWVAIGETGLDFFRDWASPEVQVVSLERHLELSHEFNLPVILHCRNAIEGLLPVLENFEGKLNGVMHCYSDGPEPIERLIELGMHVSFAGNMTFPKSQALRDAAQVVPLNRLLVETDAPFLAPQAKRGKRNEPAYVAYTLQVLAELRGLDASELALTTSSNASKLFNLHWS